MTGVCSGSSTWLLLPSTLGVLVLDWGRGTSAAETARLGGGDGLTGLASGELIFGSCLTCALAGTVRGGGSGRARGSGFCVSGDSGSGTSGIASFDGRASVTATTMLVLLPEGLSISKSGIPHDGLVVCLALSLRIGMCFRKEAIEPCWWTRSVAIVDM